MIKYLKKFNEEPLEKVVFFLAVIYIITISLGQLNTYIISEQLALAINLEKYGTLYNTTYIKDINHYASYFPGSAYLIFLFRKIIPDFFLYETLLIFSSLIVVFFFYLLKKISEEIIPKAFQATNYWLVAIMFTLLLCKNWLLYATHFKADTLAFSLIIFSFFISKVYKKNYDLNYWKIILSLLVFAFGISVKQQAVFVIPALIFFSLLNKNILFKFYTCLTIILVSIILMYFHSNENLWLHTVSKYGDTESQTVIMSFNIFLTRYLKEIIFLIIFIFFLFLCEKLKFCKINFLNKFKYLIKIVRSSFWIYIISFFSITGLLSAINYGGNSANSQLAIILIFPIFYFFIYEFKKKPLILIILLLFLLESKTILKSLYYYIEAKKFQIEIKKEIVGNNLKILSEKHTYFAIFNLEKNHKIESLNTFNTINKYITKKISVDTNGNVDKKELLEQVLNKNYDFVILSHDIDNMKIIKKQYQLIISNKFGNVYKKI